MQDKKQINFKTPDLSKMQEVVIDARTKIYIALKAAIEQGRKLKARCLPPAENPLTLPDNVYQGFPKEFQKYTFLNRIPEFVLEQREIHQLETA